jgi:hypothetical protein
LKISLLIFKIKSENNKRYEYYKGEVFAIENGVLENNILTYSDGYKIMLNMNNKPLHIQWLNFCVCKYIVDMGKYDKTDSLYSHYIQQAISINRDKQLQDILS